MHVRLCVCVTLQLLREYRLISSVAWRVGLRCLDVQDAFRAWPIGLRWLSGVWGHGNQISLVVDAQLVT